MQKIFLVIISVTFLSSCKVAQKSKSHNKELIKSLETSYKEDAIKGFSVAVVNEKGLIYNQGFGFSDIEKNKPYTSQTTQNIASISKTLIGISLLKAQELEKLDLDAPINMYFPFKIVNPKHPNEPILVKHLAYHTSSIQDLDEVYAKSYVLIKDKHDENEGVYDYFSKPEAMIPLSEYLQNSLTENGKWYQKNTFLNSKPGEQREYSNIGAALCAFVIESATRQDYRTFTKEYILNLLKMSNSGWTNSDIDVSKRSRLFATNEKMIAEYSLVTFADGGFLTTSHDLGLFLLELINGYNGNGKLLKKESYKKIFDKRSFTTDGKSENFGMFMEFRDGFLNVNQDLIGHNGSDPGVFTAMYFNPKTKIGKLVLVNTDTDFTDLVWPEIEEIWKSLSVYDE